VRRPVDRERLEQLMRELGAAADRPVRVYLTGGASALLLGFRPTTLDVDYRFEPEVDPMLRAIPRLKEELELNLEPASPQDFLPELAGWRERSRFVASHGPASFYHYDFAAQALAKVERGHAQDLADVRDLLAAGLTTAEDLRRHLDAIEGQLYRYPAVDPPSLRRRLESVLEEVPGRDRR
jgi:hypothetical protein